MEVRMSITDDEGREEVADGRTVGVPDTNGAGADGSGDTGGVAGPASAGASGVAQGATEGGAFGSDDADGGEKFGAGGVQGSSGEAAEDEGISGVTNGEADSA
jgi:ABC-2 type transport system ATP-binding protein